VNLRIDTEAVDSAVVVKIAGDLTEVGVSELDKVCSAIYGSLMLDLTHLVSIDTAGLTLLRKLHTMGAELRNASPLIQLRLKENL
jgi:anti-anti-sigma regulatory factor